MIDLPVADYLDHLFGTLPADEAVCIAQAQERGYLQLAAAPRLLQRIERRPDEYYVCVSTVDPVPRDRDGNTNTPQAMLRRTESDVRNVCMLVLDDIGTKAKAPDLAPSCRKETSAGNQQWDYIIEPLWVGPDEQGAEGRRYFDACYRALAKAGYTDPGAGGVSRVVRLPGSVNKKPGRDGWRTKVLEWEPERVYALEGIMETLGLEPIWESLKQQTMYEGVIPSDIVDPVVAWLHDRGLAGELRGDWLDIRCPWAHEHTDGSETAGYSPLGHGRMPVMRGFQCFHTSHGIKTIYDFLAWVAEQDGPSVDASGVREFHVEQLKQLTRDYTADEAAELLRCSLPALWPGDLPDCVYTRGGNVSTGQRPTQSNVRHIMQRYGIDAKLNLMTRQVELSFCDEQMALLVQDLRHVRRAVLDGCQRVGITSREVDECIVEIAADSAYHPAAVWVDERPWDGVSRLQALIDSVQCREGYEDVFGVYLRRWLIQGVQAWFGWHEPEQMALVLTLVGPQGCGKSEWMKSLMPPPFFRGDVQLDLRHRRVDSVMLMTSAALTELGELDTTFS